ncbi:hypothetical protein TrST_g13918 [Triparma strigata]|uniref:EF-hand domain-containing protein n=1 Tax=Triparma strigata TaxID=1606541 RepID=A0A9W7EMY4_9STRA|nr:hypothetical protein TrST_g13918 [Triparma strigata]
MSTPAPSVATPKTNREPSAYSPFPPEAPSPNEDMKGVHEFDNSTPYNILPRMTHYDLTPAGPTQNSSQLPMLMLMDNAQGSMIDSLQRQLAEERERGAHRLQTETLMHQLISERNDHQSKILESSKKYDEEVQNIRLNMQRNLESARGESNDALRNLNMQKRHNAELKRRAEELEKELALARKHSTEFIERNKEQLEREKAAFALRIKNDESSIEAHKLHHEKVLKEKDKMHEAIVTQMEARFKAESGATEQKFKTLKAENENKAIQFENEVEKLREAALAAKIQAEAGMHKLKAHYEDLLKDAEARGKKAKNKMVQMKWCSVLRTNAYKRKLSDLETKMQDTLESQMREASAMLEKVKGECERKLDEERASHHRSRETFEQKLGALHSEMKNKIESHSETLNVVKEEHRRELSSEVSRVGKDFTDKMARSLEDVLNRKEQDLEDARAETAKAWGKKLEEIETTLTKDKEFLEKKAKSLEDKLESLEKAKVRAEGEAKAEVDRADKRVREKSAEIEKLEGIIKAKTESFEAIDRKLAASKSINEAGVKIKERKDELESSLTATNIELESLKAELATLKSKHTELTTAKSTLEHDSHDLTSKLEATQHELETAKESNKDKIKELNAKHSSIMSQLANEKLASSKNEKDAIKALKLNHNKMVSEKDTTIAEYQSEIAGLKKKIANSKANEIAQRMLDAQKWTKEKKALDSKLSKHEEDLTASKLQMEQQAHEAEAREKAERELATAKKQIVDVEKKMHTFEEDLVTEKEKSSKALAEVKEKEAAVKEIESELAKKEKMIVDIEEELEKKETILKETKQDLEEKKKKLHISLERTRELGQQLDHSDPHSTEHIFVASEEKQAMLMRQLDASKMRIRELEAEVDRLRAQLHKKTKERKDDAEESEKPPELSHADIKLVVKYIETLSDEVDGEISVVEFEHAVRKCRRAKGCAQSHARGRLLVLKLENLIDGSDLNMKTWFKSMCDKRGGGDMIMEHDKRVASLNTTFISAELAELHKKGGNLEALEPSEITDLVNFLDPNLDGYVTRSELQHSIRRAHLPPNALYAEYQCSIVMSKLETYMHSQELRLKDIFNILDKDRSGSLTLKEFEKGVKSLVGLEKSREDVELGRLLMASKDELMERFDTKKSSSARPAADFKRSKTTI